MHAYANRAVALAALACVAVIGCVKSDDGGEPLTPAAVKTLVERQKQGALAAPLIVSHWDVLLRNVAAGSSGWIGSALALRQYADGEDAELLDAALAEAMASSPSEVLLAIAAGHVSASVCAYTFEDVGADIVLAESPSIRLPARRAAVVNVADPALRGAQAECINALDAARPK